jgi:glycosidase
MQQPQWMRSAVIYEINPRAFSPTGDFEGIRQKLDYLQQLGVTVLWLMPLHPTGVLHRKGPLGSPYSARDYYAIDPAYGTSKDLKRLTAEAQVRGLRTILDIAANHTACDAVLLEQHPDFYRRDTGGNPISSEEAWNDVYALDYSNPDLRQYMLRMFQHWIAEYGFSGFRCDIAHYVPKSFWKELRDAAGPDILLIAEAEDPELLKDAFNAGYAWKFFHALNAVFTEGVSATRLREVWDLRKKALPPYGSEMRFTDNHDETRAIVRLGERASLAASAINFLLDGIPLLYNGQEIGAAAESGPPALFDRVPIYWAAEERRPDFVRFYRQLIHLRRAHSALHSGDVVWTFNTGADRVVSFLREGDNQEFLIVVNCSNRPFDGHVDGSPQAVSLAPFGILVRERKWGVLLAA